MNLLQLIRHIQSIRRHEEVEASFRFVIETLPQINFSSKEILKCAAYLRIQEAIQQDHIDWEQAHQAREQLSRCLQHFLQSLHTQEGYGSYLIGVSPQASLDIYLKKIDNALARKAAYPQPYHPVFCGGPVLGLPFTSLRVLTDPWWKPASPSLRRRKNVLALSLRISLFFAACIICFF